MRVARPAYWHAGARPPVDINKISVRSIALSGYLPSKSGTLELVVGHIDEVPDDLVPRIGFSSALTADAWCTQTYTPLYPASLSRYGRQSQEWSETRLIGKRIVESFIELLPSHLTKKD